MLYFPTGKGRNTPLWVAYTAQNDPEQKAEINPLRSMCKGGLCVIQFLKIRIILKGQERRVGGRGGRKKKEEKEETEKEGRDFILDFVNIQRKTKIPGSIRRKENNNVKKEVILLLF